VQVTLNSKPERKQETTVVKRSLADAAFKMTENGAPAGMPLFLQPKLAVSRPDDPGEREADSIADHVIQRSPANAHGQRTTLIQPQCAECAPGGLCPRCAAETVQRQSDDGELTTKSEGGAGLLPRTLLRSGAGAPLPATTRLEMERAFNAEFGNVRVHDSADAGNAAARIHARAFTHGHDIYFARGAFEPHTAGGRRLLAHELAHTIQQRDKDIIRRQADPALAAPVAPTSAPVDPAAVARVVFTALDEDHNPQSALDALQGHTKTVSDAIGKEFSREHNQTTLRSFLRRRLSEDVLVKAYALLVSESIHSETTAMALALIPVYTRDEEVFRILFSAPHSGRLELERQYNLSFGEAGNGPDKIGTGSLKGDLKDDLSGWRRQKALALLHRDLTEADELYFDSEGIVDTHADAVVARIQAQWARGPAAFAAFENDWEQLVRNRSGWTDETWSHSKSLYDAMDEELSGRNWELVKAVLDASKQVVTSEPPSAAQQQFGEEIRLQEAEAALAAATTGGFRGLGTNEEEVTRAVSRIRAVYQERIERARAANDAALVLRYEAEWESRRKELLMLLKDEMDADTVDYARTRLVLRGTLSAADEIYLATRQHDSDRVVDLVTRTWARGEIDRYLAQAEQEVREDGIVIRPRFHPLFVVPYNSGTRSERVRPLLRKDADDAGRGARRLEMEVRQGSGAASLEGIYKFLTTPELSEDLRTELISRWVAASAEEIGPAAADNQKTDAQQFVAFIERRYEATNVRIDLQDELDPARDAAEMLRRATARHEAATSGAGHKLLDLIFTQKYDIETGEDTLAVEAESLARLRYIVAHTGANRSEIEAMMAIAGVHTVTELSKQEYGLFRQRLDELRALREALVDAIVTVAQLVVETAVTVLTAGAAGPMLLASLATTIAGIVAHELALGGEYETFSEKNAKQLALIILSHGAGAVGRGIVGLSAEEIAKLSRARAFFANAAQDAFGQVQTQLVSAGLEGNTPTAEGIAAAAFTIVVSSAANAHAAVVRHTLNEQTPNIQRLRTTVITHVASNVISGNANKAAALVRSGTNLTIGEIGKQFGESTADGIGRGLAAGIGDYGAHVYQVHREAQRAKRDPDELLHHPSQIDKEGDVAKQRAATYEPGTLVVVEVNTDHAMSVVRGKDGKIIVRICSINCGELRTLLAGLSTHENAAVRAEADRHLQRIGDIEREYGDNPMNPKAQAHLKELAAHISKLRTRVGEDRFFGALPEQPANEPEIPKSAGEDIAAAKPTAAPKLNREQRARINDIAEKLHEHALSWSDLGIHDPEAVANFFAGQTDVDAAVKALEKRLRNKLRLLEVYSEAQKPPGWESRKEEKAPTKEGPDVPEGQRMPRGTEIPEKDYGGEWGGERGNSEWFSDVDAVNKVTGYQPIEFHNGYPDFSPWAKERVVIKVTGNDAVDFAAADEFIFRKRGFPNKTAYADWRSANRMTWHHIEGASEMILVPRDLHENVPHVGGASEARAASTP